MSNNRVAMVLKTKDHATKIATTHSKIKIKDVEIQIRKYITPDKRLTITVPAYISNELLATHLNTYSIKLISEISHIPISNDPKYSHISSGRRAVMVIFDDNKEGIPDSFLIKHEYEEVRIFIQADTIKCDKCRHYGHGNEQCPNATNQSTTNSLETERHNLTQNEKINNPRTETTPTEVLTIPEDSSAAPITDKNIENIATKKRQHSLSAAENSEPTNTPEIRKIDRRKRTANKKKCNQIKATDYNKIINKITCKNPEAFLLNSEQIMSLIETPKSKKKINKTIKTWDLIEEEIINTLDKIYPEINNIYLKKRITQIKDTLLRNDESPNDTSEAEIE